jgi:Holliday junction resolvase RusA-like endonuclease
MRTVKFTVPLYLTRGKRKKKNYWLTQNNYRNWQFHLSNDLKKQFKEEISIPELDTPLAGAKIKYVFYFPTHQRRDIGNMLAVVSKFTEDALVAAGIIKDDDYTILKKISGEYGGYDKNNPRCEVTVEEIEWKTSTTGMMIQ